MIKRTVLTKLLFFLFWFTISLAQASAIATTVVVEIDTIGMTADAVENVIAEPIEILLGSLAGVSSISAKYHHNKALINVKFVEDSSGLMDSEMLTSRVKTTIDNYMDKLPPSIDSISVSLDDPSEYVESFTTPDVSGLGDKKRIIEKPSVISRIENRGMIGRYLGNIQSANEYLPIITTLVPVGTSRDSAAMGKYVMSERDNIVRGGLSNCYNNTGNVLTCQWQDKYGAGNVDFTFSPDFTSFTGRWSINGKEGIYKWSGIQVVNN